MRKIALDGTARLGRTGGSDAHEDHEPAATVEQLSAERDHYRKLYLETLERCAMLERGILVGKKAERFEGETPQLALDMLDMLLGSREAQPDDAAPDLADEASPVHEHRGPSEYSDMTGVALNPQINPQ